MRNWLDNDNKTDTDLPKSRPASESASKVGDHLGADAGCWMFAQCTVTDLAARREKIGRARLRGLRTKAFVSLVLRRPPTSRLHDRRESDSVLWMSLRLPGHRRAGTETH